MEELGGDEGKVSRSNRTFMELKFSNRIYVVSQSSEF